MMGSVHVPKEELADTYRKMVSDGAIIVNMFAEEPFDGFPIIHIVLRNDDNVTDLSYTVDGEAVDISEISPVAERYERLIHEMNGISFGKELSPIVYRKECKGHPLQKEGFDRNDTAIIPPEHNRLSGVGVFEIPVGPVHAGIIEPGHFRFSVAGEPIMELNPTLGYTHRGVEKLLEGPANRNNVHLVERVSGDTCVANAIAYSEIIEDGNDIPERASYLRMILAEMERLYNHMGAVAGICTDTAFTVPSAIGNGLMERMFQANMQLMGHRQLMNAVCPGGVRRDITDEFLEEFDDRLLKFKFEIEDLEEIIRNVPCILDRMDTTGKLSNENALKIGATGPIGRASNVKRDVRKDRPYERYDSVGMRVITEESCDVSARTYVRINEMYESISIMHQCISKIPEGEFFTEVTPQDGVHIACVEAPRGELVHSAIIRNGDIWRYSIRDPSFVNWPGMCYAVPGNVVPDFPLINKSFGLSYSGHDL